MQVILRRTIDSFKLIFSALYLVYIKVSEKKTSRRVVLFYHNIRKVDIKNFEKQMAYISEKCKIVKPSQIKSGQINNAKILIAIIFDDALVSVMENAVPILLKYDLPAGISVPAGNLGKPPDWEMPENVSYKNEGILTEAQISELDRKGFEILSHTLTHSLLTSVDGKRLESELIDSKLLLERIIGHDIQAIVYPEGAYNDKICSAAKKAGYKFGFTVEPSLVSRKTDDLKIGRFRVFSQDNLTKFKLKVNGAYQVENFFTMLKEFWINHLKPKRGIRDL